MINGLNYNGFEQLNGLHLLYADEIQIDKIDQKEINTLDNINTTTTIQQQLNTISSTIVNVLPFKYITYTQLSDGYYSKSYINSNFTLKNTFDGYQAYISFNYYTQSQSNTNYYTKSFINSNYYNKSYIDSLATGTLSASYQLSNYYDISYIDTQYNTLSGYITYLNEYIYSVDSNIIDFYVTYDYLANTYDSDIKTWSNNKFNLIYTKTEINNQNLTLSDYITTNYTNLSNHVAANYISINAAKNRYYEKTYIDTISDRLYTKYYDASYIDLEIYKTLTDRIDTYHYTKNDINYKFITISDYILSNYNLINQNYLTLSNYILSNYNLINQNFLTLSSLIYNYSSTVDLTAINTAKNNCIDATDKCKTATNDCKDATIGITAAVTAAVILEIGAKIAGGVLTSVAGITGAIGPGGPAGPKGDKGNTGNTGDKGDKGDKGDTGEKGDSYFTKTGTIVSLANSSLQVVDAFSYPMVNLSNSSFTSSYFGTDVLFKNNITLSGSLTQNGSYMDYYTNGNSHRFYNITAGIVTKKLYEINEDYIQHHGNYALMACQANSNKRVRLRTDVTNYSSVEFLSNLSGAQFRDAGIDCLKPTTDGYEDAGSLLLSAATISIGSNPNGKTLNITLNAPYVTIGASSPLSEISIGGGLLSRTNILGTLYINGQKVFRSSDQYSNGTEFNGYITQI